MRRVITPHEVKVERRQGDRQHMLDLRERDRVLTEEIEEVLVVVVDLRFLLFGGVFVVIVFVVVHPGRSTARGTKRSGRRSRLTTRSSSRGSA